MISVVDPDPVGSETFSRIRKKSFRIRAAPDPKWIWNKILWPLWHTDKIWQFLNKMLGFKNINSFKKDPLKSYLTHSQDRDKTGKFLC